MIFDHCAVTIVYKKSHSKIDGRQRSPMWTFPRYCDRENRGTLECGPMEKYVHDKLTALNPAILTAKRTWPKIHKFIEVRRSLRQ